MFKHVFLVICLFGAVCLSRTGYSEDYRPISEDQGRVRFIGEGVGVASRKAADTSTGYAELLTMTNNALVIYWTTNAASATALTGRSGGFFADTSATTVYALRSFVNEPEFAKKVGASFDDRAVKSAGDVAYIMTTSPTRVCFFGLGLVGVPFDKSEPVTSPGLGNRANTQRQGLKTRLCYRPDQRTEVRLEAEMLAMLARARFDNDTTLEIPTGLNAVAPSPLPSPPPDLDSRRLTAAPGNPQRVGECPYTVEFPGPPKSSSEQSKFISTPWDRQLNFTYEDSAMAYVGSCGCSDKLRVGDVTRVEALAGAEASAKQLEMKLADTRFKDDPKMGKTVEWVGEMPSTRGPLKLQARRYFVGQCSFSVMVVGVATNYDQ